MDGINFVALNIQTANHSSSSICAIGLVKFRNGKKIAEYTTLVDPEEEFEGYFENLHGITSNMVIGKPTYPDIAKDIIKFSEGLPLVSHYAPFPFGGIAKCNKKYGIRDFNIQYFCSKGLTKALYTKTSYDLPSLCKDFDIALTKYNALSHAEASGLIIMELLKRKDATDLLDLFKKAKYKNYGLVSGFERKPFEKSFHFNSKEHVHLVDRLDPSYFDDGHPFHRKYIVITGTLESGPRDYTFELIENVGGIREERITKKTNFLIMGEQKKGKNGSNKISDVQKKLDEGQEIEILGEADFLRMLYS